MFVQIMAGPGWILFTALMVVVVPLCVTVKALTPRRWRERIRRPADYIWPMTIWSWLVNIAYWVIVIMTAALISQGSQEFGGDDYSGDWVAVAIVIWGACWTVAYVGGWRPTTGAQRRAERNQAIASYGELGPAPPSRERSAGGNETTPNPDYYIWREAHHLSSLEDEVKRLSARLAELEAQRQPRLGSAADLNDALRLPD